MKLSDLVKESHQTAKEHGWWDTGDRNPLEIYALVHTEISEAVEEARKGNPAIYQKQGGIRVTPDHCPNGWDEKTKPEGELVELADCIIRIADYCGRMGWNLEEAVKIKMTFNRSRGYRHGGKKF